MRTAFIEALCETAERDPRVWLVCGDLGYSVLEPFARRFPSRYVNAGVAEQNMTGVAAGLALAGKVVFTYSIANFPVMRCLEQVRNDVCYHDLPVKIVAVGGGVAYGSAGYTHHGVEDLAVMRALPRMTVCAPGDPHETRALVPRIAAAKGPCYLRLGKAGEPAVHPGPLALELGRAVRLVDGTDAALVATGGVLTLTVAAREALAKAGVSCAVWSFPTVQPLDAAAVDELRERFPVVVGLEEHGTGGFTGALAEALLERGFRGAWGSVRLAPEPLTRAGSQEALRAASGLSVEGIVRAVTARLPRRAGAPATR
jgi:transketolase